MLRLLRTLNTSIRPAISVRHQVTTHYSLKKRESDPRWKDIDLKREEDDVDVLIVGGGPAGLSSAIRLAQRSQGKGIDLRICVIEKASEFGGHMLSGACFEPRALDELIPDWRSREDNPVKTKVNDDRLSLLTQRSTIPIPIPPWFPVSNHGNYVIRLGNLVKWLSEEAERLGVELYSGVGGNEVRFHDDGSVKGIGTADSGIHKDGSPKENFERGMALNAKVTLFAEGCHGSLTKDVIRHFNLRKNSCPQTYSLGLKELWLVKPEKHKPGCVEHSVGFPMDKDTYGGSFEYHLDEGPLVSLGLVVSLNYSNPYLNPFKELQLFKTHPRLKTLLQGGERIGYGARALNEGGFQAIPKLVFPGGCLVGCAAGFLNISKIKGIHTAMKSGILAADAALEKLSSPAIDDNYQTQGLLLDNYEMMLQNSWLYEELKASRNVRPSFETKMGLYGMLFYTGALWPLLKGREPTTLKWKKGDHDHLLPAEFCKVKHYPKPDNKITFDLMSSVALTNTNHDHDEPSHLTLYDDDIPQDINFKVFAGPEQRYCPAGVYEYVDSSEDPTKKVLQINAQNCIHCKTCDIKDPRQNINWVVPQNGGGPNYSGM